MNLADIIHCPGSLKAGYDSYNPTTLKHLFKGKKVSHILPYESPANNASSHDLFVSNRKRISISGVQEKFSVLLEKNKLRLINEKEQGEYILKPIPSAGKNTDQMPANEHLTMQIAKQVFGIETAENGLIFFKNGAPAYITKRFDVREGGGKWAQEDFATLAERTPQTHGEDFKYLGNYLDLFDILKNYVSAYKVESIKLFKLILFNYLISNGDAHFKNFSLIETALGDYKLSPAYDLLNSRIHIEDKDFALENGLLPLDKTAGTIKEQFHTLGKLAEISESQISKVFNNITSNTSSVLTLIDASFLKEKIKRNYTQEYQTKLKRLTKV